MSKGTIFWLLMILWFVFGAWTAWNGASMTVVGGNLLVFILFFLLGWHCFGFVVQE